MNISQIQSNSQDPKLERAKIEEMLFHETIFDLCLSLNKTRSNPNKINSNGNYAPQRPDNCPQIIPCKTVEEVMYILYRDPVDVKTNISNLSAFFFQAHFQRDQLAVQRRRDSKQNLKYNTQNQQNLRLGMGQKDIPEKVIFLAKFALKKIILAKAERKGANNSRYSVKSVRNQRFGDANRDNSQKNSRKSEQIWDRQQNSWITKKESKTKISKRTEFLDRKRNGNQNKKKKRGFFNRLERIKREEENKKNKLKEIRKQLKIKEMKECTFKPKILEQNKKKPDLGIQNMANRHKNGGYHWSNNEKQKPTNQIPDNKFENKNNKEYEENNFVVNGTEGQDQFPESAISERYPEQIREMEFQQQNMSKTSEENKFLYNFQSQRSPESRQKASKRRENVYQKLYEEGQRRRQKKGEKKVAVKLEKAGKEMQQCTFKPKLTDFKSLKGGSNVIRIGRSIQGLVSSRYQKQNIKGLYTTIYR